MALVTVFDGGAAVCFPSGTALAFSILSWATAPPARAACDHTAAAPVTASTINDAIVAASAGETVCIPDGIYFDLDLLLVPDKSDGTPAHPIVLRPQTLGGVTFSGILPSGTFMEVDGDWWTIRGFQFVSICARDHHNTRGLVVRGEGIRFTNNLVSGFGIDLDTWDPNTTYDENDTVYHEGMNYYSVQADNTGREPGTDNAWWAEDAKRDWFIWYGPGTPAVGGAHARVDHNTFDGNEAVHLVFKATATNSRVDHNKFSNSLGGGTNGHEIIYVGEDFAEDGSVRHIGSCIGS
ncbi:chondroitinase-B domain-containing protein [Myxococcota bacterium]